MDERTEEQVIQMQLDTLEDHFELTVKKVEALLLTIDVEYGRGAMDKDEYIELKMAYSEMLETAKQGLAGIRSSNETVRSLN